MFHDIFLKIDRTVRLPSFLAQPGRIPFHLTASFWPWYKNVTGTTTFSKASRRPEELHAVLRFGITHTLGERFIPRGFQPQEVKDMSFHTLLEARRVEGRRRIEARRLRHANRGGVPAGPMAGVPGASLTFQRAAAVAGRPPPRFQAAAAQVGTGGMTLGDYPGLVATRTWQTFAGGPTFTRYDGFGGARISVTKKAGTIKVYRPYKPVVIPKNWKGRAMGRVATALKHQQKMAIKIVQLAGGEAHATKRAKQPTHQQLADYMKK